MLRALANDKLSITGVAIFGHASALLSYRDTKLRCAVASTTTRQNEIIQFMHCRSTMPLFSYSRTRMKRAVVNAAAKRVAQPDAPHILSAEYVFWITSFYATAFAMVHITAHSPRSLPTRRGQDHHSGCSNKWTWAREARGSTDLGIPFFEMDPQPSFLATCSGDKKSQQSE
jgi:hypothetical protein